VVALVFSVFLTVYLIIPEAIFRVIFGWFLPTKEFVLTRTDTAYRAVLVSLFPFVIALGLCWCVPGPRNCPFPVNQNTVQLRRSDYKVVAAALYSEAEYSKSPVEFWHAFTRCSRRQARLVSWYFPLVALEGLLSGLLAVNFSKFKGNRYYTWLADKFLFIYISKWHPLLTPYLDPDTQVQADILCTNDTLYQGYVSQYFLKDGQLSGIILSAPKRFNRQPYLEAKNAGTKPNKSDYWVPIPSKSLIFLADKIFNMNVTYVPVSGKIANAASVEEFLAAEFTPFEKGLGKLTVSVEKEKAPSPDTDKKNDGATKTSN
jgi:hypothetical protein